MWNIVEIDRSVAVEVALLSRAIGVLLGVGAGVGECEDKPGEVVVIQETITIQIGLRELVRACDNEREVRIRNAWGFEMRILDDFTSDNLNFPDTYGGILDKHVLNRVLIV